MKNYLAILIFLMPFFAQGQTNFNETKSIQETAENYFYGYVERDSVLLLKAFDTKNGTMKLPTKSKDGTTQFENGYFKNIIPRWSNRDKLSTEAKNNCALEIQNIDVVNGKIATVKLKMTIGETIYIDILSLQKINQVWKSLDLSEGMSTESKKESLDLLLSGLVSELEKNNLEDISANTNN